MEVTEPLMECNFPEMLAGDLGLSEEVFRSKNLTAGAPAASLSGNGGRRHSSLQDRSSGLLSSPENRNVLTRMRSLQTIESGCFQLEMAPGQAAERRRGSFESTSTDSSGGMEPPSVAGRGREVSVGTAATSVTSERFSPSDKSNSPIDKTSNGSWTDLQQLATDAHHNSISTSYQERCRSLSNVQQPPTPKSPMSPRSPRDTGGALRTMSLGNRKPSQTIAEPMPAFKSPMNFGGSMQFEAPSPSKSSPSKTTNAFPTRRSSLTQNPDFLRISHQRVSPQPSSVRHSSIIHSNAHLMPVTPVRRPSSAGNASSNHRDDEEARSMLSLDSDSDDEEDEKEDTFDHSISTPRDVNQVATPTIVSPLADIERWVDQSSIELTQLPSPTKDYQGSRLHVAPEVLDTLRISVACFPETILVCSSLSIETIRNNGKKRFPPAPSDDAMEPRTHRPVWQSIKNIFPKGTDHLCDALYAHILAFNYVTSVCPPSTVAQAARPASKQSQSSAPSISDKKSVRSDNNNKIPHKAATLLGLENDPSAIAPPREPRESSSSSTSRPTTSRGKAGFMQGKREATKTFGSMANRTADDHDQSLKDLRYGLAKCIARLVGTLRLTTGETLAQSTSMRPGDIKDVDPLFIRALCEVVRCNEEG
ncbi:hypothetical protein BJ166DRAFT_492842 [Pestalotiopsis sp. NC0098]|nr:hypothetical protein BJ166DRAFT_492842 [Pestalotiopsis sp. NC0098]